jgi:hypothetical protein
MVFMGSTPINAIDTQELILVFAIKSDKIAVQQTLLRKFVLI